MIYVNLVDFDNGVLGLAWVGNPSASYEGGICYGGPGASYNTGEISAPVLIDRIYNRYK